MSGIGTVLLTTGMIVGVKTVSRVTKKHKKVKEKQKKITYPRKSKKKLTYHGRSGYPILHKTKTSNQTYIMVRARKIEGGGTKRLYLDKSGNVPKKHRKPIKHRRK